MMSQSTSRTSREWLAPASGSQPLGHHDDESERFVVSNCLCPRKRGNLIAMVVFDTRAPFRLDASSVAFENIHVVTVPFTTKPNGFDLHK